MKTALRILILSIAMLPVAAGAHTGDGAHHGFVHGFFHPLGGLDHLLAMIAIGLLAAHLGGRALWLVPASFVALMAAGGVIGFSGFKLPYFEVAIALSVVVLGLLVALRANLPLAAAAAIAGGFAVFHGYAHGAELPAGGSALPYAAGFLCVTALLHLAGIALGIGFAKLFASQRVVQAGGGAMALIGAFLVFQAI